MEFKSLCTSSRVGGLDRVRGTPLGGAVAESRQERMASTPEPSCRGPQGGAFLWASHRASCQFVFNQLQNSPELSPCLFPLALPK